MSSYLSCRLCEKQFVFTTSLCEQCRRIKHLINIYGDDVYYCLEECLVRDRTKQDFKINKINKNGLETDNSNDRLYKAIKKIKTIPTTTQVEQLNNNVLVELKGKLGKLEKLEGL